jgi:hypothetical protein
MNENTIKRHGKADINFISYLIERKKKKKKLTENISVVTVSWIRCGVIPYFTI